MRQLNFYISSKCYFKYYYKLHKNMSFDAKMAYVVLKDKLNKAIKNNWRDENNLIYFSFTNKEWQDIFCCDLEKVSQITTELIRVILLYRKGESWFYYKVKK